MTMPPNKTLEMNAASALLRRHRSAFDAYKVGSRRSCRFHRP